MLVPIVLPHRLLLQTRPAKVHSPGRDSPSALGKPVELSELTSALASRRLAMLDTIILNVLG